MEYKSNKHQNPERFNRDVEGKVINYLSEEPYRREVIMLLRKIVAASCFKGGLLEAEGLLNMIFIALQNKGFVLAKKIPEGGGK